MYFQQHVDMYIKLLNNFHISEFLNRDSCGALCDKYHLAIVFQFFMRADLKEEDYTAKNFFLALILSHDLYEDSPYLKQIIMNYYFNRSISGNNKSKRALDWEKLNFFKKMQYKGFIKRNICRKLFELIPHKALNRARKELHTGHVNFEIICKKCKYPSNLYAIRDSKENAQKSNNELVVTQNKKTKYAITEVKKMFFRNL